MKHQLLARIAADGPLPFEEFMRAALYGPGGFFVTGDLRSVKGGDFLTSPEVSASFGETLAAFVGSELDRIGEPFTLVEVGGGSGSLLRPLLATQPVPTRAIEASPAARAALGDLVGPERVHSALTEVPSPIRGVVLANELLDNLPMAVAQLTTDGWRERWVGADGAKLCFIDVAPRPAVAAWLADWAGPVDEGGWVEVQLEASQLVEQILLTMATGTLVMFDYGDTMENLAPRRRDGTLRTYRSHHLGPHPLDEPGATDITADVNFTAMVAAAEKAGAEVEVVRQDDFLARWGLRDRVSRLRHHELELARRGDDMARLAVRAQRHEAETLMHPRGLGDFRVLVAKLA